MSSATYKQQRTIQKEGVLSGIGLHTGKKVQLTCKPALAYEGIRFYRAGKLISDLAQDATSFVSGDSLRCSSIGRGDDRLLTVEHLLAALRGLGITNIRIEVEGPEVPGMDGSALPFVSFFKALGLQDQQEATQFYRVREPIFCYDKAKSICILPADEFSVSYVLDYDHPHLKDQKVDFVLSPDVFEKEIAPSRTFCTEAEALEVPKHGLGLGASVDNTLIVKVDGSHLKQLRYPDECARHKVLDILGDFNLLGFPVLGRVVAIRSGHALNQQLVQAIKKQRDTMKMPMELEQIKKILPHRYPFLLVDRILEMSDRRIVGLKNVSGAEPFFQGHFPQRPVMPGVLMIEALAQVGGVLMLVNPENQGKMAYLASVKEARFRRIVVPGDQLRLEVDILKYKSRVGLIKAVAKVGDEVACEAEMMFSMAD